MLCIISLSGQQQSQNMCRHKNGLSNVRMLSWGIGLRPETSRNSLHCWCILFGACCLHAKEKECFVLSVCCFMLGVSAFFLWGGGACITLEAFHAAHACLTIRCETAYGSCRRLHEVIVQVSGTNVSSLTVGTSGRTIGPLGLQVASRLRRFKALFVGGPRSHVRLSYHECGADSHFNILRTFLSGV